MVEIDELIEHVFICLMNQKKFKVDDLVKLIELKERMHDLKIQEEILKEFEQDH